MGDFWDQDLSAHAFSTLAGQNVRMHSVKEGYELMTDGPIDGTSAIVIGSVGTHSSAPTRQGDPACSRREQCS